MGQSGRLWWKFLNLRFITGVLPSLLMRWSQEPPLAQARVANRGQIFREESRGSNALPGPRALANHPPPRVAPFTPIPGGVTSGASVGHLRAPRATPCAQVLGVDRPAAPRHQVSSHLDFQELLIGPAGFGPPDQLSCETECVCVGGDKAATWPLVQHRASPPTCVAPVSGPGHSLWHGQTRLVPTSSHSLSAAISDMGCHRSSRRSTASGGALSSKDPEGALPLYSGSVRLSCRVPAAAILLFQFLCIAFSSPLASGPKSVAIRGLDLSSDSRGGHRTPPQY
ncbi:hypothetical protein NDU88_002215, partial [Pleurodeles waltl]